MECGLQLEVPQPGKTKKQQEAPFNECLCKTIAEMDMSARAERCLSDNEVKYIYDLVQMSENELKSFKDMDSDILDEIRDELAKLDLGFEETVSSDIVKQCQKWRKDLAKQSGGLKAQEPELDMEVTLNVNLYKNIEDIGLSERTKNCMKLNGIDYVYQLVTKTDKDLRKIKDVGPSALEEIEKALEGLDLALEQKLPPDIEERFKSWRKENVHEADDDNLHKKVDELGLSERAKNCMKEANIESVEQLIKYTREGLLKIKDFNDSALKELEKTLKEMGLSLAESAS
ncbi:MAG: hypothetical protein LBR22_01650 [Desulfovibrio sp.]|nr:hypothetical protein [Desulfovibrio sp.]